MCGIAGFLGNGHNSSDICRDVLEQMNRIQRHRGPDGEGVWWSQNGNVALGHTRLSIIDIAHGAQPMVTESGNVITYNGEIYNYLELRERIGESNFRTHSDTEVILLAYEKWGADCVEELRGMFAFTIWDSARQELFIARDRFGIKPYYYCIQDGVFYFASEIKALLPLTSEVNVSVDGLRDYFTFQFCLGGKTLFKDINELKPAHYAYVRPGPKIVQQQYWEVHFDLDWDHTENYFVKELRERFLDSVRVHLRSDVEVGAYVSGGLDSSLVASAAKEQKPQDRFKIFNGRFLDGKDYDESVYAEALASERDLNLHLIDIGPVDFVSHIKDIIYYLDFPVAGPGSFPQFMVSKAVQKHVKVVLGGQGGDEIFGGYTRYLIAYFEQCIKGAIEGTLQEGNFIVTYESIIPNLRGLERYKPLIKEFWSHGLFEDRDRRYFQLVNRANNFGGAIDWSIFNGHSSFEEFQKIYWGDNVGKESYFDSVTHFDFKTLLPALLQVEDRMSMAHSIESRVPLLDHPLVDLAATIPANIKFQNGELKRLLKVAFPDKIPPAILAREDKMGFPVPLAQWMNMRGPVREFLLDVFSSKAAKDRFYLTKEFNPEQLIEKESKYGRSFWALLSLELWQNSFLDNHKVIERRPT